MQKTKRSFREKVEIFTGKSLFISTNLGISPTFLNCRIQSINITNKNAQKAPIKADTDGFSKNFILTSIQ